jgi:hypothetical protein
MADPEEDQSPMNLRYRHQSREEWRHRQILQTVAVVYGEKKQNDELVR